MEYDAHTSMKVVNGVSPAALAINTNGAAVDTLGYESVEWVIHVGTAFVGGGFDITMEQSPDDGSGSPTGVWTAVPEEERLGSLSSAIDVQVAIGDADKLYRCGSIGKERHQRVVLTETGVITGGVIGVSAILGHPKTRPEADQNT